MKGLAVCWSVKAALTAPRACCPHTGGQCRARLALMLHAGFYIVTYALGIYNLNLLLGFLTPQFDPENEDGMSLPTKSDQEFRPFVRRLPEFKFW